MKKVIILLITIVLLTGCGKKQEEIEEHSEEFVLEKIDDNKELIYLEEFKNLKINNKEYKIENIVINIKSDIVDNINLELSNFVMNSYNSMNIVNDVMKYGNVIDYEYYVTDKYVTVIQNYSFYINNSYDYIDSNIYVVSLDTGKLMNKNMIMDEYGYNENKLYEYLEEHIDSEDKAFTLMQVMNDGYKLYVDDNNRMVIVYSELFDDGSVRKELVIEQKKVLGVQYFLY